MGVVYACCYGLDIHQNGRCGGSHGQCQGTATHEGDPDVSDHDRGAVAIGGLAAGGWLS
jgi:hypothetical protein